MFTLAELEQARSIVAGTFAGTPQYRWPLLAKQLGAEVWIKHENHTPTGAFKVRGGLVYMNELCARGERPNGLITATRGNHGQSIPFAARQFDLPVTVYVPEGNSSEKNAAMEAWGANLVVYGQDFDEARVESGRVAERDGLEFVPSFHPALVRGVATYAFELFSAVSDLDTVYVPVGMGSGICALLTVRDLLGLETEIVGVVAEQAPAYALSFESDEVVETNTAATFADGVACRVPSPAALDVIRSGVARFVQLSETEIAEGMRTLYRDTHNVAEGAGAAAFAAATKEQERNRNRKIACVLTGGNVDTEVFAEVLRGATPGG